MQLSMTEVQALAPDASAASTARKLASSAAWRARGLSERAAWGDCQGSALYHTAVALPELAFHCSCPSRKFPCKHALALLFEVGWYGLVNHVDPMRVLKAEFNPDLAPRPSLKVLLAGVLVIVLAATRRFAQYGKRLWTRRYIQRTIPTS